MISPIHIIHQVLEKRAPTNWLVLRPMYLMKPVVCIFLGSVGGLSTMLYGTLFVAGIVQPSLVHQEDAGPFGQPAIVIPMIFFSLIAGIVVSRWLMMGYKRKRDSLLILVPEGVVSCNHFSDQEKRSYHVIDYTDIALITMTVRATQYQNYAALSLQYRDGRLESWSIDPIYGSPERMAERVIKAHHRFVKAHPETLQDA